LILTEKSDKLKLMKKNSRIPGFFKLNAKERTKILKDFAGLTNKEIEVIKKGILSPKTLEEISENVIGIFPLPYSVAPNFLINGKDYFVPMVTEEPSVVAAASYGAKLTRENGGIFAKSLGNLMIGQIYIVDLKNAEAVREKILKNKVKILKFANKQNPVLTKLGGGVKDFEIKVFKKTKIGSLIRIHLLIDTKDAMGANTVDFITERTAFFIEKNIIKAKSLLKIVSNLAEKRLIKVKTKITRKVLKKEGFFPEKIIDGIVKAQKIAEMDIYRAVTHNKGILNGMTAVALACGNDYRALEAGAHGFASRSGRYRPLSIWKKDRNGDLIGEMTVPIMVGTVGGVINIHPIAKISLKILKVKSGQELAEVIASVGLIQNFSALRALVSEGIFKGHLKIRAKNIAMEVGAKGKMIEKIADQMVRERNISFKKAKEILRKFKK